MSLDPYKRNEVIREKTRDKKLNSQELISSIIRKEEILLKEISPKNRLTGNTNSIPKNKNTIIHSNSTNHLRQQNKNSVSKNKNNNYNIININVNNLIINNNINDDENKNRIKNNDNNMNKVFSKIGNDIIIGNNLNNNNNNNDLAKKNKSQLKTNRINYIGKNSSTFKKNQKDKYESLSNIQNVIDNLIEATKCTPPGFINYNNSNNNMSPVVVVEKNNNNSENNSQIIKNDNLINIDEKDIEIHSKLWEIIINMELHVDNKIGLGNQLKKLLALMENNFISKDNKTNIFPNNNLNNVYNKSIKIIFILSTYIKFILLDFNYEMTIKSNVKRLLSTVNENILQIISTHIFIKDNITENNSCGKISKEFIEVYSKIIKTKKIKKNIKDSLITFCKNINKNLEISITSIKQFSNNFFKIGYFNPIHSIFFDIFRLLDSYKIYEICNIILNGVLFYILHNNQNDKKNTAPKLVTLGNATNTLAALGFINVPAPYLPKLPPEIENYTYTLVLDLDETLVHFFYTPSGGTFLIRPYCFEFLEEMSKIFETVIFTAALKDYADSILDLLDPNKKFINHRLYRHHTSICGITFVKDLSKIGRDLNKTIIIDNLGDNFKLQPNNGIQIGTWLDDMKDTQLDDLGKILKDIVNRKPSDIRPIIKKFKDEVNKKVRNNMSISPFKGVDVSKYFK